MSLGYWIFDSGFLKPEKRIASFTHSQYYLIFDIENCDCD